MPKRKQCQNKDCGILFAPCPQVPKQKYCSRKECQRARKREWNKNKLSSDPDYRENRKVAQQRWKEKNPVYWKNYRACHSKYTAKNRQQQRARNQKQRHNEFPSRIAKTDESISINSTLSGRFRMIPVRDGTIVKTDECIVEIAAISSG